jgi:glycosyltransferase involved in cell wall biosynthesis
MRVSVLICTQNRSHAILNCLDAVVRSLSQAGPIEAEIVVVDNASTDDTSNIVRHWAETCAFHVQLLFEPEKGLSAARNCALRAAKGDLLVFTDDDCMLSETYIVEALRYDADDREPVLRGGCVELGDPEDLPITIKSDPVRRQWSRSANSIRKENLGNAILGCNMTMRRILAQSVGMFDRRLGAGSPIPGGDDIDYVFRAYLAGFIIEAVPDMAVVHFHGRKTVEQGFALFRNYCIGGGAIYAKFLLKDPNFCRQFYWDIFSAVKEIKTSTNNFMPAINFSNKDKILYSVLGIGRFAYVALTKRP